MTPLAGFALLGLMALLLQTTHKVSQPPIETSMCQLVRNSAAFAGKLVRFHATFLTDHIERSILIDQSCSNSGGILPYQCSDNIPGGKSFQDAIGVLNPATLDETISMTVTGIFHYAQKPEMCMFQNQEQCKRSIAMTRIQDLTVTMKPKE